MHDAVAQLETLYREHSRSLMSYFRRQRALAPDAEDLLQDTFVRAIRSIGRLRASVSPRAYLFGIARHVSLDALRQPAPAEPLLCEPHAPGSPAEDPRLELLRTAIARLPEAQRETLLLKLQHDLSYEEIAEVLAIPIGTVRSRLHHAVLQLRSSLNPGDSNHET
jgi:RNA polymerase sigma-70 factor (ECF subfamily)